MAMYNETRQGQSPKVSSAGGGSLIVDWQQQPTSFQRSSEILSTIMQTLDQEEQDKQKKLQNKFDTYRVLRESGYDTKAAYQAMETGDAPSYAPSETVKSQKEQLDLQKTKADIIKTEADTQLSNEKSAAYARGDIGKRKSSADKMNAAQLQREIKRVSDPFENPDYDSEESQSYVSYLNQKLQQISQYTGAQPVQQITPAAAKESPLKPAPAVGKIRVKRKSDGVVGTISESNFDPKKYERA